MAEDIDLCGGCNCGAIRYTVRGTPIAVVACHCTSCRRQSGAAYSVNLIVRANAMTVEGLASTWLDKDTQSGTPLAREFCGRCGTPIRSIPSAAPKVVALKAGSLDEPAPFAPGMHIWTRSKLPWISIEEGMPSFEEGPPV